MEMHEGNRMGRRKPKRTRLVAAATALVSVLALSAPALAGAATYGNRSITITQNTSMIVDVSTLSGTTGATVSWGDVSWSDVL
jgi:hypothetical protein